MSARARQPWSRRVLATCPVLVALLWVAGIARFRDFEISALEWAALAAVAFALHIITRRARRPRPLPKLPEGANPAALAAFAAAIVGVLIAGLGLLFEWLVEAYRPTTVALPLRALWHGACAFGAAYCGFLLRLQIAVDNAEKR